MRDSMLTIFAPCSNFASPQLAPHSCGFAIALLSPQKMMSFEWKGSCSRAWYISPSVATGPIFRSFQQPPGPLPVSKLNSLRMTAPPTSSIWLPGCAEAVPKATVRGPLSLIAVTMASVTVSIASSQLMRSNSPWTPFSLVRRMGYLMRLGLLMISRPAMPRGHRWPALLPSELPS